MDYDELSEFRPWLWDKVVLLLEQWSFPFCVFYFLQGNIRLKITAQGRQQTCSEISQEILRLWLITFHSVRDGKIWSTVNKLFKHRFIYLDRLEGDLTQGDRSLNQVHICRLRIRDAESDMCLNLYTGRPQREGNSEWSEKWDGVALNCFTETRNSSEGTDTIMTYPSIHPFIYGVAAPSGPCPLSEDSSIILCLLLVFSTLLFLWSVMWPSGRRTSILFLVFPVVLCNEISH